MRSAFHLMASQDTNAARACVLDLDREISVTEVEDTETKSE